MNVFKVEVIDPTREIYNVKTVYSKKEATDFIKFNSSPDSFGHIEKERSKKERFALGFPTHSGRTTTAQTDEYYIGTKKVSYEEAMSNIRRLNEIAEKTKMNPTRNRLMKKEIEIDSKEGKKDLLDFFQKKFPSLSKKEIKDQIEESLDDNGRYSSYGTCYKVEVDGEEFNLIPSFDTFHDIAIDYVTQMLEDEPELFTQSWLESHLYITDTDKRLIAGDEAEAYIGNMTEKEIADEYENKHGELLITLYESDDGEEEQLDARKMREELYDAYYDYVYGELERDAVGYFTDNLGYPIEDLMKNNLFSIDIGAAAEDAVQTDGEAHFLSHYDGNYEETNGGIIVMKE
jgi:hypothetical protein